MLKLETGMVCPQPVLGRNRVVLLTEPESPVRIRYLTYEAEY